MKPCKLPIRNPGMMGEYGDASQARRVVLRLPRCRVCGCTDDLPCPGGCYWAERDLCSECE